MQDVLNDLLATICKEYGTCRSSTTTVVIILRYRLLQSCIQVVSLARYREILELMYLNTCDGGINLIAPTIGVLSRLLPYPCD